MIIGAWFVLQGISKISEFVVVGSAVEVGLDYRGLGCITGGLNLRVSAPPSRLALIIRAWLVLMEISKSSEFAGVGSTVEVGFDYRGLA